MTGRSFFFPLCGLLLLLGCLGAMASQSQAVCSTQVGRATINELYRGSAFFMEVKLLDDSVDYSAWTMRLCNQSFGCTANLPLSGAQKFGPYLVVDTGVSRDQLDFSKNNLDVILKDGAGNAIDYLSVSGHAAQGGQCGSYAYGTDYNGSTNSFSMVRNSDGSGPWENLSPGNSGEQTPGSPNVGSRTLPQLSVAAVSTVKGTPAAFVLQLDRPSPGGISVAYRTLDDTARAGTDYTSRTGTVTFAAGTTQATVNVPTTLASPSPLGVFFWLNLFNQNGILLIDHFSRGSITAPVASVDHFRLSFPATALTCQRADVLVQACANTTCSTLFTGSVTLTLSPSGWVGGDTKTFSGGSATYSLRRNTPGVVTLGVASPNPAPATALRCFGGTAGNCTLEFFDSGFLFTVPNFTSCGGSGNITLQAVRKSPTTEACIAAGGFASQTKTLRFWSNYLSPASGTRLLTLGATNLATSSPGTSIALNFDASARATISLNYRDAGQLRLDAAYTGSGEEAGLSMTGSASFVVKPSRLDLTATTDGVTPLTNTLSTGNPLWKAGENFPLQIAASCADGTVTPNFAAATTVTAVAPFEPATGVLGTLNNSAVAAAAYSSGVATPQVNYTEVGNVTLQAAVADYLGAGSLSGTSSQVGRFTPNHFALTLNSPALTTGCASGGFTYLGQPFGYATAPVITATAQNRLNGTTRNYTGAWWKLTNASTGPRAYSALSGSLDLGLLPGVDPAISSLGNGVSTLTFSSGGGMAFIKGGAPVAPFNAEIALTQGVTDTDGIAFAGNPARFGQAVAGLGIPFPAGKTIREGRLVLDHAYGSELLPLRIPLRAEYYTGGDWVTNTLDNCSSYAAADLTLNNYQGGMAAGETIPSGAGVLFGGLVSPGSPLLLSAPGVGNHGSVDLTLGLALRPWLRSGGLDPSAKANFGLFRGNRRTIYQREIVQ